VKSIAQSGTPGKEKAVTSDRKWFSEHPKRRWRIRPFIKGEDKGGHNAPPRGFRAFAFVERLPSGGFVRRWFMTPRYGIPANCDQTAALIFAAWTLAGEDTAVVDIPPDSDLRSQLGYAVAIASITAGDDAEEAFCRTLHDLALNPTRAA
jgi:hypothetical protein